MERKEAIRGAYRMTGENGFYDGMITCSTLSGKAVCRLVWAMASKAVYLENLDTGLILYEKNADEKMYPADRKSVV